MNLLRGIFGFWAAELFLGAWLLRDDLPPELHKLYRQLEAEIDADAKTRKHVFLVLHTF